MSQINSFVGSVMQAPTVQQQQAAEKDGQMQRASDLRKNAGLAGDRFEHAVESAEAVQPIHDEKKNNANQKRQHHKKPEKQPDSGEDDSLLDLKA